MTAQQPPATAGNPVIRKPVVIIRHGKCGKVKLTKVGAEEVDITAEWLQKHLGDEHVLILHSPIARAEATAKIVADKVKGTLVPRSILSGEEGDWDEFQATVERLQGRKDVKVIVIVTHQEVVETLIARFGETSGVSADYGLKNAEALVLKSGAFMSCLPTIEN